MSVEVELLREKAAQMRALAEAANTDEARTPYGDDRIPPVQEAEWGKLVHNYLGGDIGEHCAAWTPAAASLVADLLEKAANQYETEWDDIACADNCPDVCAGHGRAEFHVVCNVPADECPCLAPFVVVAREFLRRDAGWSE